MKPSLPCDSNQCSETEDGQEPRRFGAGNFFVMKPGYIGKWKTIETVRKVYVVVG